jgi:hypothetical protein
MARPRLLDRIADRDQGIPPALVVDGSHPVELNAPDFTQRGIKLRPFGAPSL